MFAYDRLPLVWNEGVRCVQRGGRAGGLAGWLALK